MGKFRVFFPHDDDDVTPLCFFFGSPWGAEVPDPPWKRWGRWPQTLAVLRHGWRCLAPRCLAMRVGHDSCHEKLRVSEKHDSIFRVVTVDQGRRHWNSTHVEAGFFSGVEIDFQHFEFLGWPQCWTDLNQVRPGSPVLSFGCLPQPCSHWINEMPIWIPGSQKGWHQMTLCLTQPGIPGLVNLRLHNELERSTML